MEIKKILLTNKKQKPDDKTLSFGKQFTDHMFTMTYEEGKGWFNPTIEPYAPILLEPSAMVFHYGQAVFEGLKAYRTKENKIQLFRPTENFKRLNVSDERLCIPELDVNQAMEGLLELLQVEKDWVPKENGTSLYIRPFIFATEPALGVHPSISYKFMIILSPVGAYYAEGLNPVKIQIEDELVRAVKGGTGFTKASANYAISLKAQVKAHENGYSQVLWLDGVNRKYIEEVGAMNVMFVINNKIVTPSLEGSILPGITRDSVIKLAKSFNMEVEERLISIDELCQSLENGTLTEAFGTGTAAVISPIGAFNWKGKELIVGNGKIGNVAQKLYDTLTGIQYGTVKDEFNWIVEI